MNEAGSVDECQHTDMSVTGSTYTENVSTFTVAMTTSSNTTTSSRDYSKQRTKGDNSSNNIKLESSSECQGLGADLGLTPSLLDEVLTEKKMGLLRSPEVMKFLQAQQAKLANEKSLVFPPSSNTEKTGKS